MSISSLRRGLCRGSSLLALLLITGASATVLESWAAPPVADPGDGYWDPRFTLPPGVNGAISSVVTLGRDLFVGGQFTIAGNKSIEGLARWDGTEWWPVGEGLNGQVNVLRVSGLTLYVGGRFRTLGTSAATNIAKWTARRGWELLGKGVPFSAPGNSDQYVSAIAVRGKQVVIGGSFTSAGGVAATNIASWDSVSWSSLQGGIGRLGGNGLSNWRVDALVWLGKTLYAGGVFDRAGDIWVNNIAAWDGQRWSNLDAGLTGGYNLGDLSATTHSGAVTVLARSGQTILVGGSFTAAGSLPATNLATWKRGKWGTVGGGIEGEAVRTVVPKGAAIYVGGFFHQAGGVSATNLLRWSGRQWAGLDGRIQGPVNTLALRGRNLYVGGYFGLAGDTGAAFIARHDQQGWSALKSGTSSEASGTNALLGRVHAIAVNGSDVYVGGQIVSAGSLPVHNIVRWDGNQWHTLGAGIPNGFVTHVVVQGSNIYVAGSFVLPEVGATNLACWNGLAWSALAEGVSLSHPVLGRSSEVYISALAVSQSKLYVAGTFNRAGTLEANGIACWDGYGWLPEVPGFAPVSDSSPYSLFSVLESDSHGFFAAGSFTSVGNVSATNLARWDGTSWTPLAGDVGPALPSYASFSAVRAMAVVGTNLFVSGDSQETTPQTASLLRWDGQEWHSPGLASTTDTSVFTIAVTSRLYIGGTFTDLDGIQTRNIARWNGTSWAPLRGGVGSANTSVRLDTERVETIKAGDEAIYVGGLFGEVDGQPAFNFAVWREFGAAPAQPFPLP